MNDKMRSPTVTTNGKEMIQLRPSLMLMLTRIRAAAATLELSLEDVQKQCRETTQRLLRLGATQVDAGEPHEDETADTDPTARLRTTFRVRIPRLSKAQLPERPGINVLLTARWNVEDMSAEQILVLVDQLRFDSASTAEPPAESVETTTWEEPIEKYMEMMTKLHDEVPIDLKPQFLFITRPNEEALSRATSRAFEMSKRIAERLAKAAGKTLGELSSVSSSGVALENTHEKILAQHQFSSALNSSSYELLPEELVSDDVRPVSASVSLHATYVLD